MGPGNQPPVNHGRNPDKEPDFKTERIVLDLYRCTIKVWRDAPLAESHRGASVCLRIEVTAKEPERVDWNVISNANLTDEIASLFRDASFKISNPPLKDFRAQLNQTIFFVTSNVSGEELQTFYDRVIGKFEKA